MSNTNSITNMTGGGNNGQCLSTAVGASSSSLSETSTSSFRRSVLSSAPMTSRGLSISTARYSSGAVRPAPIRARATSLGSVSSPEQPKGQSQQSQPTQQTSVEVRVPFPKNHVMISLIEESKRSRVLAGTGKATDSTTEQMPSLLSRVNSWDDGQSVQAGINSLVEESKAGTYQVVSDEPLSLVRPAISSNINAVPDYKQYAHELMGNHNMLLQMPQQKEQDLHRGHMLQVVDVCNGAAVLSRGQGYVLCPSSGNNGLVKVGPPKDKACAIEAMIETLNQREREYARELAQINKLQSKLRQDLREALESPYENVADINHRKEEMKRISLSSKTPERTFSSSSSTSSSSGDVTTMTEERSTAQDSARAQDSPRSTLFVPNVSIHTTPEQQNKTHEWVEETTLPFLGLSGLGNEDDDALYTTPPAIEVVVTFSSDEGEDDDTFDSDLESEQGVIINTTPSLTLDPVTSTSHSPRDTFDQRRRYRWEPPSKVGFRTGFSGHRALSFGRHPSKRNIRAPRGFSPCAFDFVLMDNKSNSDGTEQQLKHHLHRSALLSVDAHFMRASAVSGRASNKRKPSSRTTTSSASNLTSASTFPQPLDLIQTVSSDEETTTSQFSLPTLSWFARAPLR